jgi:hypothetical protein
VVRGSSLVARRTRTANRGSTSYERRTTNYGDVFIMSGFSRTVVAD